MKSMLKDGLAIIFGLVIGGIVNMSIVFVSSAIIAPPEGADVTTLEGLKASLHLFEPKHYIMPFLAHALGTFVGALVAAGIGVRHKMRMALVIGFIFLAGGFTNIMMLPSPLWFSALDLIVAYFPMAYIAGKIVTNKKANVNPFGPVL